MINKITIGTIIFIIGFIIGAISGYAMAM